MNAHRRRRQLSDAQLVAVRAMVGLPPDGSTPEMTARWDLEEALTDPETPPLWLEDARTVAGWLTGWGGHVHGLRGQNQSRKRCGAETVALTFRQSRSPAHQKENNHDHR